MAEEVQRREDENAALRSALASAAETVDRLQEAVRTLEQEGTAAKRSRAQQANRIAAAANVSIESADNAQAVPPVNDDDDNALNVAEAAAAAAAAVAPETDAAKALRAVELSFGAVGSAEREALHAPQADADLAAALPVVWRQRELLIRLLRNRKDTEEKTLSLEDELTKTKVLLHRYRDKAARAEDEVAQYVAAHQQADAENAAMAAQAQAEQIALAAQASAVQHAQMLLAEAAGGQHHHHGNAHAHPILSEAQSIADAQQAIAQARAHWMQVPLPGTVASKLPRTADGTSAVLGSSGELSFEEAQESHQRWLLQRSTSARSEDEEEEEQEDPEEEEDSSLPLRVQCLEDTISPSVAVQMLQTTGSDGDPDEHALREDEQDEQEEENLEEEELNKATGEPLTSTRGHEDGKWVVGVTEEQRWENRSAAAVGVSAKLPLGPEGMVFIPAGSRVGAPGTNPPNECTVAPLGTPPEPPRPFATPFGSNRA